jgi:hypothetical protein
LPGEQVSICDTRRDIAAGQSYPPFFNFRSSLRRDVRDFPFIYLISDWNACKKQWRFLNDSDCCGGREKHRN